MSATFDGTGTSRRSPDACSGLNGHTPSALLAARCGMRVTQAMMLASKTSEATQRLKFRPPSATGLSRRSPSVAPRGRVKIKAAQNRVVRDAVVQK